MNTTYRLALALAFSTTLLTGTVHANSLLDSVKSAADQYSKSGDSSSSLSSLTGLLNGGDKGLSASVVPPVFSTTANEDLRSIFASHR